MADRIIPADALLIVRSADRSVFLGLRDKAAGRFQLAVLWRVVGARCVTATGFPPALPLLPAATTIHLEGDKFDLSEVLGLLVPVHTAVPC